MRVALFTETYVPYINGVVTHVKILKEGLERLGHTVLVVTADPSTRRHYIGNGVLYCPATRVKRFYNYGVAVPYSRTRQRLLEEFAPDIIHIHNEFGIGLSGMIIAKQLRVPLVYTLHTMYDEYVYYVAPKHLQGAAKQVTHQYGRFLAEHADALTGPSKKCALYFRDLGIRKRVHVIPNAVELDAFAPGEVPEEETAALRQKLGIPQDRMLACFVGRLGREKSVDVLLEHWSQSVTAEDGLHLLIIGDGPVREELEAQAQALGLGEMVTFAGAVEHNDLAPYYACCDVYITASLSDTNSISMLEGMATGLPVLQRLDRLNANQVREGQNGFLWSSPQEMGEKLRLVQAMPATEREALRERTAQSVRSSGAEDLARNTLAVYEKALRRRQRHASFWNPPV